MNEGVGDNWRVFGCHLSLTPLVCGEVLLRGSGWTPCRSCSENCRKKIIQVKQNGGNACTASPIDVTHITMPLYANECNRLFSSKFANLDKTYKIIRCSQSPVQNPQPFYCEYKFAIRIFIFAWLEVLGDLTCISYAHRAGMAATLEESDFTTIQQRLRELTIEDALGKTETIKAPQIPLMPLTPQSLDPHPNAIGFSLRDYLELVDWAGRAVREDKRGAIDGNAPPILERLNLDPYRLIEHVQGKASTERPTMLGKAAKIKQAARDLGRCFIKGISEAQRLYRTPLPT